MKILPCALIGVLCLVLFPVTLSAMTDREIALQDIRDNQERAMRDAFPGLYHTGNGGSQDGQPVEFACSASDWPREEALNATDTEVLSRMMNGELFQVKNTYNLITENVSKIQNRGFFEKSWVYIFGGDAGLADSIYQNIEQYRIHSCRMQYITDTCNCPDKIGYNKTEYSEMMTRVGNYYYSVYDEKYNKGIIGNVLKP